MGDLELAELKYKVLDDDSNVKTTENYEIVDDSMHEPVIRYDEGIQPRGNDDTAFLIEIQDIMKTDDQDPVTDIEAISSLENKKYFGSYEKVDANNYNYEDEDNDESFIGYVKVDAEYPPTDMPLPLSQVDVWSYYDDSPMSFGGNDDGVPY